MEWISLKIHLILQRLSSHMFKINTTPAPFSLITLQSLGIECLFWGAEL